MPLCSDPFVSYLKGIGYSALRLPRKNFHSLDVLADMGRDLTNIGPLNTIMMPEPETVVPKVSPDEPAANVSGESTADLSLGLGLTLLDGILGAMGGSKIGIDSAYKSAKSLTFSFSNVFENSVQISELDQFLGSSDVNPRSKGVLELLDANDVYVVTSTIKSREITVSAKSDDGADLRVEVPVIQEIVGANVKVAATSASSSGVTYTGNEDLVFGFQAIRLFFTDGRYTSFEPLEDGRTAARGLAKRSPLPPRIIVLEKPTPFVRMVDA